MSPTPITERRALPVAPRPFEAEVLGGWIGRLAARYRMSVHEFEARYELDLQIEEGAGWLVMPAPQKRSVDALAALTRMNPKRTKDIQCCAKLDGQEKALLLLRTVCVSQPNGCHGAHLALGMAGPKPVSLSEAWRCVPDAVERSRSGVQKLRSVASTRQPAGTEIAQ